MKAKVGSLITKDDKRRSPIIAGRETCPTSILISDPTLLQLSLSLSVSSDTDTMTYDWIFKLTLRALF